MVKNMLELTLVFVLLELVIGHDTLQNITPADGARPIIPWLEIVRPQDLHHPLTGL